MIGMNKKYRTKSGLPARIICTDAKGDYQLVVLLSRDDAELPYRYTTDLRYSIHSHSEHALFEVSQYEDFEIDDKVWVWSKGIEGRIKRHFAGVGRNGKPLTWKNGETSFTRTSIPASWDFCEKYVEG